MTGEALMRVTFVQSGGLVGAVRGCELDSATLGSAAARELEELVRSSGLSASGEFRTAGARDLREYAITVEDGARRIHVHFDDRTLPAGLRALVSFLRRSSTARSAGP